MLLPNCFYKSKSIAVLSTAVTIFIAFTMIDFDQLVSNKSNDLLQFTRFYETVFDFSSEFFSTPKLEPETETKLEQSKRRLQLAGVSLYYFAGRQLKSPDVDADYLLKGIRDRLTVIESIVNESNTIVRPLLTSRNYSAFWSTTIHVFSAEMQHWIDNFTHYVDSMPLLIRNTTNQSSSLEKSVANSALAYLQECYHNYLDLLHFWTTKITDSLIDRPARIKALAEKFVARWTRQQFPHDCQTSKLLICNTGRVGGFGATSRWVQYCFWLAFLTNRVLYYNTTGWYYTAEPYEKMLQPLTNCTDITQAKVHLSASKGHEQVVYLDWFDPRVPDYRFRTMPLELERELQLVDLDPFEWLGGLIAQFIVKLQPNVRHRVDDAVRLMNFSHPIVGMHVRRTDKRVEAPYQPLEVYFRAADLYFDQLDGRNSTERTKRRVFIATDEPKIIQEAIEKNPNYEIFADVQRAKSAATGRTANDSLLYLLIDMYSLLDTDHLVCTMSSNFCLLLHQMRLTDQTKEHTTTFVDGWDVEFLRQRPRYFYVLYPQNADAKHGLIETKVNDTLRYHRFEPDGMIRGENLRTKQVGQFHYFKVSEVFHKIDSNNTLL